MSEYSYDKAPTNPHHGGKMTPTDMVRYIEKLEAKLVEALEAMMSDYNMYLRRDGTLVDRFTRMLNDFRDDFEEEIVVVTLLNYYNMCSKPDKIDNSDMYIDPDDDLLWAIDRVLQDFMTKDEYNAWSLARAYKPKE